MKSFFVNSIVNVIAFTMIFAGCSHAADGNVKKQKEAPYVKGEILVRFKAGISEEIILKTIQPDFIFRPTEITMMKVFLLLILFLKFLLLNFLNAIFFR